MKHHHGRPARPARRRRAWPISSAKEKRHERRIFSRVILSGGWMHVSTADVSSTVRQTLPYVNVTPMMIDDEPRRN